MNTFIKTALGTALLSASVGAQALTVYAVTTTNQLGSFDSATPAATANVGAISGLQSGEVVLGIDFRPATGQLFALGSTSRLYVINTSTAAATLVGSGFSTPTLFGLSFGFDFNPTVDRIRSVSDGDQNLRLNPITGGNAATDTTLAYAGSDVNAGDNPAIVGSAYTNNFAAAPSTVLYGIDWQNDILVTQSPPNAGTLNTVGALGINTSDQVGFDIFSSGGIDTAFASLTTGDGGGFYGINLLTGSASLIGYVDPNWVGVGNSLRDIAIAPVPLPGAIWLLGGALGFLGAARRRSA